MKPRTIECIGYIGHECGKIVNATSNVQKRCSDCAPAAHRAQVLVLYRDNPRAWVPRYEKRKKLGLSHESNWRSRGIIMKDGSDLTYEQFEKDVNDGCMFKDFGVCSGKPCADHDHETGIYRGILCFRHNMAFGMMGDSLASLKSIVAILQGKA